MERINVFYQRAGSVQIELVEVHRDETFEAVALIVREKHGLEADILLFIEDHDEPLDRSKRIHEYAGPAGVKLHVHRCRHVAVSVTYNGTTASHEFAPGATVARVRNWAAEKKFGMSPEEAGEHPLQLSGTQERPMPGTHIGALVTHGVCKLAFDLVADERVHGSVEK